MKEWEKAWEDWKYGRIASDASDFKAGWYAALERVGKELYTEEDVTRIVTALQADDPDNLQS